MSRFEYVEDAGCWVVTDYALASQVLSSRKFSSATLQATAYLPLDAQPEFRVLLETLSDWFVLQDGEAHTQARRRVQPLFGPRRVRELRNTIRSTVAQIVGGLRGRHLVDLVSEVAQPVSATSMAIFLGLKTYDSSKMHEWSNDIAGFLGRPYSTSAARCAQDAMSAMQVFLTGADTDLWQADQALQASQLATGTLMLFGGLETSAALISHALQTTLTSDLGAQMEVEALLDYELATRPPLGHVARVAMNGAELDGERLPKGALVLVSLDGGSPLEPSNLPHPYPPAHEFSQHLSFGQGLHYCMGATLARLEAREVVTQFRSEYPIARITRTAPGGNRTYRGLGRLEVELT